MLIQTYLKMLRFLVVLGLLHCSVSLLLGPQMARQSAAVHSRALSLSSAALSASPAGSVPFDSHRPSIVDKARTITHVCTSGTLCTSSVIEGCEGSPFGSYVDYILDGKFGLGCCFSMLLVSNFGQLWSSPTILYNIASITHNHHTNIFPLINRTRLASFAII